MRTTLNIDDKTYNIVRSLANANHQTISRTIDSLLAAALKGPSTQQAEVPFASDPVTGFPVFRSLRTVTDEDVNTLISEE